MMDRNDIDMVLHEIQQMVSVSITALDPLMGTAKRPDVFEMPATNADLLTFAVFEIRKRVTALRQALAKVC